MSISVVINTLNEEANIADCIRSVQWLADEIVVCDMYSDDSTVEIARNLGAKIVFHKRVGFVEPARYFAISQAQHEWVLVLDADERMTEKLARRLTDIAMENKFDVVSFWSLYWYFGGWVSSGGFYSGIWTRFFRKQTYLQNYAESEALIHRNFETLKRHPNQIQLSSDYFMYHLAYPFIEKYITKTLGAYARIEAEQYRAAGRLFRIWRLILSPIKIFFTKFFLERGYKDGTRGFILCILYAGYIFAIWANLWFLEDQARCPKEGQNE